MDTRKAAFLDASRHDVTGGLPELRADVRAEIRDQILDEDPPEVWETAQRLLDGGLSESTVLSQLVLAWLSAAMTGGDEYLDALDRLPVPHPDDIEEVIVDVVRDRQPIGADEVDERVAEALDVELDDPVIETVLDRVHEDLLDDGVLVLLAGDVLVHVASFTAGIVLTHRVTVEEAESGVLDAADLAAFGFRDLRCGGDRVPVDLGEDGGIAWHWPPEGALRAGSVIAVRVSEQDEIHTTVLDADPPCPDGLVATLRAGYDAGVAEPWLPVDAQDLVLLALIRDRDAFSRPVLPLTELAEAAGLERRGDRFAHDESVWRQQRVARQARRLFERLGYGPAARDAILVLARVSEGIPDPAAAREVLRLLYDPDVLEVVPDELLGDEDDPVLLGDFGELAERLLVAASRSAERAVAHWLAALAAERRGEVLDAESQLRAAARVDPDWPCTQDRLAWYESDRGDADAAVQRWRRLGVTAQISDEFALVESFAGRSHGPEPGRNQPCWCGSGRKYKACHLGSPVHPPLPERIGWLCQKAVAYLRRRGGMGPEVVDVVSARAGYSLDDEVLHSAMADPMVFDTLLHRRGWFKRFLADRGPLLPDDEAMLAQAWTLIDRSVHEVLDTTPGVGLTVRELRTGDRIEVRERSFSRDATVGMLVCARVVPDGESHQLIGGVFHVEPGTESDVLQMLESDDDLELLCHLADRERPPHLTTPEGDDLLDCRARLEAPDPEAARAALDDLCGPESDGWVWSGESTMVGERVLATLSLDDSVLTVRTMSGPRLDAVLAELAILLPGVTVVSDEREPLSVVDGFEPPVDVDVPPEVVLDVIDRYERAWCDEPVPALHGWTPRAAAADPTRREEVSRLIATFPDIDPTSGRFGMRPARLRELLELD